MMNRHATKTARRALLKSACGLGLMLSAVAAGCGNNGASNQSNQGGAPGNAAASGSGAGEAGGSAEAKSIAIGYNPTIAQPQALVGVHDGRYAAAMPGVSVTGQDFAAGPEVVESLRAGKIDIGCSGPFPAMKAYLKAGDIVLLCGAATGGTELMVQASSPIKSVKDLKGKVVGVNQAGSTVETMVRYQVVQAGLKPEEDVRFIEVKPAEQAAALQSGDVAAVAAPAPWPSFVQINAKARPLLNWKQIYADGKYLSGSFYATKKWVEANPKLARQFVAATKKITDELNANRAKGDAQVLAAWEKVTRKTLKPEVARAAFKTIQYTTEASEAGLQKFADINFELGVLKGDKPQVQGFVWK